MAADWDEIRALLSRPALLSKPGVPSSGAEAPEPDADSAMPAELLEWLAIVNGAHLGQGGLFGLGAPEAYLDIAFHSSLYPAWRAKGWIPVAGDGCGNYYVLLAGHDRGKGNPVLFVDTSDDTDAGNYLVASSLFQFLRFYLEAAIDRTAWPFGKAYVLERDPAILDFPELALPWDDLPQA
jgi:hypothetical protein